MCPTMPCFQVSAGTCPGVSPPWPRVRIIGDVTACQTPGCGGSEGESFWRALGLPDWTDLQDAGWRSCVVADIPSPATKSDGCTPAPPLGALPSPDSSQEFPIEGWSLLSSLGAVWAVSETLGPSRGAVSCPGAAGAAEGRGGLVPSAPCFSPP